MEIVEEDALSAATQRKQNRDDTIRLQIRASQLKQISERVGSDLIEVSGKNETLVKDNDDLESRITTLDRTIMELIARVDLNTLLKEVDLEDLKMLANNNTSMNMGFMQLLQKWEHIDGKSQ